MARAEKAGDDVVVQDLYADGFNPTEFLETVTGKGIRRTLLDGTFMQLGIERRIWHNLGCCSTSTEGQRQAWLAAIENGCWENGH